MHKTLLFVFTILIIVSCSKKESVPNGIIPPEKMAQIIAEIYNAEYKVSHVGLKHDSTKVVFRHYELKIFEDFNVSDSIYKKSFAYYLENPNELESVYDIVIDSLSLQEQVREAENRKKKDRN
ncbi:DUF4296 domain-containing protein [Marivirga atlantica]|uniref:DUF4296 domain-containing protein n=1 Tax=Marivirga atlantica TaxID=1548457 RepID=A0A937DKQ6_9BACT|nr:DUF4296 domain-containing protein [Marivirga atlantica]MBL0766294.1 DUF4296 domain-containing protein [Marivirga atlantica]